MIKEKAPHFTFVNIIDIDIIGHQKGFGNEYSDAIKKVDTQIGSMLEQIQIREKGYNEDWLVVLVTDHGRDLKGHGHGGQTITQKTIFIGLNKKGNIYFNSIDNNKKISKVQDLETLLPQTAVVPTILKHLNITIKKEWLFTQPLIN